MADNLDYRRWLADGGETDEFRNDPRVAGWQQRYNNESRRVMGSGNNMVAVLGLLREARWYVNDSLEAHEHSDGRDLLNRIDARLASPQPDSQQGEAVAWCSPGQLANLTDVDRDGGVYLPIRKTKRGNFTMALFATPSSPALDAATIERCARDANEFAEVARQDGFDGADALDLIEEIGRTLAKASTIERDQDDLDTPEARLAMVRVAVWHITQGGNAGALAKAALDFIDLTAAQRAEMRGDAA